MTNTEIIEAEKMLRGLDCDAHTYAAWMNLGYQVKKGEKAAFSIKIWQKSMKKKEDGEEESGHYFMKLSHFFTIYQVEQIK